MAKNFLERLLKVEHAVNPQAHFNPHDYVLESPSPSFNFMFGNAHGMAQDSTMMVFGPGKCGKSLIANAMIGQLHKNDPEAYAIKFDSEFREHAQNGPKQRKMWGIDDSRYVCHQTNSPKNIFNYISKDVNEMCKDGMPLRLVVIDSLGKILGRRAEETGDIEVQQRGDHALTIQNGLDQILATQKKYRFGLILVCHAKAEQDPLEVQRGNKWRPGIATAGMHYAEYFVLMEPNRTVAGRKDMLENEFKDESRTDMAGNSEQVAHKIRAKMLDSSLGPKKRVAEFTFGYGTGFINTHEEVFVLGVGQGIISKPNNVSYECNGKTFRGKAAMLEALKEPAMAQYVLKELKRRDLTGEIRSEAIVDTEAPVED